MAMCRFAYHRPSTLGEALELVNEYAPKVKVIAGGTDLVNKLREGLVEVDHLVSLSRIRDFARIGASKAGLVIGAGSRISDVGAHALVRSDYPALASACSLMATTQIRNMGTVAGNIANGSPCADTAAPLMVYEAVAVLASRSGSRRVPVTELFRGPGVVDIGVSEILETIILPSPPPASGSAYLRLSARSQVDMAAVCVAGRICLGDDARVVSASLALGAVGPTPLRCPSAEAMLVGNAVEPALITEVGAECARISLPIDDMRATAAYRRAMVAVLAERVIGASLTIARGGAR